MGQNMTQEGQLPFSRPLRIEEIPGGGLNDRIAANPQERAAIAGLLDLLSLDLLECAFELKRIGSRGVRLKGGLRGKLAQKCVVSLDPIDVDIDVLINIEFVSEREFARRREAEEAGLSDPDGPDIEPIPGDEIDLGQLAYECLATELEPYPRKEGLDFRWEREGAGDEDGGPFAALKVLKEK